MKSWLLAAVVLCGAALAASPEPQLAGLQFLVGQWSSDDGKVAETGGSSKGTSTISVEANGNALLRRDHTDLFDAAGKAMGSFDQIMLIYGEGDAIKAEYTDGQHVIHYDSTTIVAGKSVTFSAQGVGGGPAFQLAYEMKGPGELGVIFSAKPPGADAFMPIASGTLKQSP